MEIKPPSPIVIFQGHIAQVATRRDRSVKMVFETASEITDSVELSRLFALTDDVVSLAIKPGRFTDHEVINIPEPEPDFRDEKSPGQRLRAVVFRYWESKGKPGPFDSFYRTQIENLISQYKDKL